MGRLRNKKVLAFMAVGLAIALLAAVLPFQTWFEAIQTWLTTLGLWSVPAFILIYVAATVLGIPNILLILIAGTLFGLAQGLIYASVADWLGAIACYGIGRTVARKQIKRWMQHNPHFDRLDRAVEHQGWKILLLTRLSPMIPSNVLNYGFSCTKVNFWQYSFFSWLGMIPVISFYVYMGAFGSSLLGGNLTPSKFALQSAGVIFSIVAAVFVTRFVKKTLSQA